MIFNVQERTRRRIHERRRRRRRRRKESWRKSNMRVQSTLLIHMTEIPVKREVIWWMENISQWTSTGNAIEENWAKLWPLNVSKDWQDEKLELHTLNFICHVSTMGHFCRPWGRGDNTFGSIRPSMFLGVFVCHHIFFHWRIVVNYGTWLCQVQQKVLWNTKSVHT